MHENYFMQNKIHKITKEMIRLSLFDNLSRPEMFRLQNLLASAEETNSVSSAASLLTYWYRADFFHTERSAGLLHPCNALLQGIGMPCIEIYEEEGVFAGY